MTFKPISIICFALFVTCFVVANFINSAIIGAVNLKSKEEDRFSHFGWNFDKANKVRSRYKKLYPNGRLQMYYRLLFATGLFFLFVTAITSFHLSDTYMR
jgi:hypothetical protein